MSEPSVKRRVLVRRLLQVGGVALLMAGAITIALHGVGHRERHYVTVPVERGDITRTVTTTGSLIPMSTVSVGPQVSGPVLKLYADYNDQVKKGQLLAEIDPALLVAQLQQSEAQLTNAKESAEL